MQQRLTRAAALVAVIALMVSAAAADQTRSIERRVSVANTDPAIRSFGHGADRSSAAMAIEVDPSPLWPGIETQGATGGTRISGAAIAGGVVGFAASPDGSTAVYIADQDTANLFELYRAPVDGSSPPVKISSGLSFAGGAIGISRFEFSPDGSTVVFLADAVAGGGSDDIYSVPTDGSAAPVRLNAGAERPVLAFGFTSAGSRVAFFGSDTTSGTSALELFAATVGSANSATQLSDAGAGNVNGNVTFAEPAADGSRVVYRADGGVDGVFQWYSVPLNASGPGFDVQLSASLGSAGVARIDPASGTVVYAGDDDTLDVVEVYAVPIVGGTKTKLNPSMAGSGATALEISPDGTKVAYIADQTTAGVLEVYAAGINIAGSGIRLNTAMAGTQGADTVNISPDSSTVVYGADQVTADTFELFGVSIDGSSTPDMLHDLTAPEDVGFFAGLGRPIIGGRTVYPVFGTAVELYSAPYDGSEPFARVNGPLATDTTIFNAFVPSRASRLLAYGTGMENTGLTRRLFVASVRGDLPAEQVNTTASSGALGVVAYEVTADEDYAVFVQDRDATGTLELFSKRLDSDGDTVANVDDNCPFVDNSPQGPVLFGQDVLAIGADSFGWAEAAEVRYVRGPLAGVSTLAVDESGSLADAATYTDPSMPAPGAGFYYLFAPDCSGGSYQTVLGAEPDRDSALP